MPGLTDNSPMPFGKYKGRKMKEVPATYLDWLHDQSWLVDWPLVKTYIEKNRRVIDQEIMDRKYEEIATLMKIRQIHCKDPEGSDMDDGQED